MEEIEIVTVANAVEKTTRLDILELIPTDMRYRQIRRESSHLTVKQPESRHSGSLFRGLEKHLKSHTNSQQPRAGFQGV
jgi:hypothetical protein